MEVTVDVPEGSRRLVVLGSGERNLKMLREMLGVQVSAREGRVVVSGDRRGVLAARRVLDALMSQPGSEREFPRERVFELISDEYARFPDEHPVAGDRGAAQPGRARMPTVGMIVSAGSDLGSATEVFAGGKALRPRTANQADYLRAIQDNDLVFASGPAGTGKTYLAVAAAVHLLRAGRVRRLVLVRPAVEAGEKLGFLPGDLQQKVNPYLRPLFDALHDMMDYSTVRRFTESDVVEVVPLAYMRGRTLNSAVIILDEAQNTTRTQMKMFLTRMGHDSKMIVTGDPTQIDLPDPRESGLIDAVYRLRGVSGIGMVTLSKEDVVRHPIVQRIVERYGEGDAPEQRARHGD